MKTSSVCTNYRPSAFGMFSSARQPEIVRSNQKDEYYSSYIRGALSELNQSLLGMFFFYEGLWQFCIRSCADQIYILQWLDLKTASWFLLKVTDLKMRWFLLKVAEIRMTWHIKMRELMASWLPSTSVRLLAMSFLRRTDCFGNRLKTGCFDRSYVVLANFHTENINGLRMMSAPLWQRVAVASRSVYGIS